MMASSITVGAIVGISLAACCVPCCLYGCVTLISIALCGDDKYSSHWAPVCDSYLRKAATLNIYASAFICILCPILFLVLVLNTSTDLALIYSVVFAIVPSAALLSFCGTLSIILVVYRKEREHERAETARNSQVNKQLLRDRHNANRQNRVLLMGNHPVTNRAFFNALCICHAETDYHLQLLYKHLIRNLQSLIILTLRRTQTMQDCYDYILKIPTVGLRSFAVGVLPLHETLDYILETWNDDEIQTTFTSLQHENHDSDCVITIYADDRADNPVNVEFLKSFLNDRNIKVLFDRFGRSGASMLNPLDEIDQDVLMKLHEHYQDTYGHSIDSFVLQGANQSIPSLCVDLFNPSNDESVRFMHPLSRNDSAVLYIIDVCQFCMDAMPLPLDAVVRYWFGQNFFANSHAVLPVEVEQTIVAYVFLENDALLRDIDRCLALYNRLMKEREHIYFALLFANGDKLQQTADEKGIESLNIMWPKTVQLPVDQDGILKNIMQCYTEALASKEDIEVFCCKDVRNMEDVFTVYQRIGYALVNQRIYTALWIANKLK